MVPPHGNRIFRVYSPAGVAPSHPGLIGIVSIFGRSTLDLHLYGEMEYPLRTKLISLGAATLLATATLPFAAATASASEICRAGSVCTWSGNDFGGTKRTSRLNPSSGCYPWGGKTVSNQTTKTIRVYSGASCYGKQVDIESGHWGQTKPGATINSIAVLGQ